ncbi:MAG: T9SS type A sorting domain-containing protein [Bacteroidales bacterium]|nr:T9SS type A sorting domain-containing protein [Bacteroidales bacterium]
MKKTVLFIALLSILSIGKINAQCTPVPFPGPALTDPDASQGIPPAVATFAYNQVINMRIPIDTLVSGYPIAIDSVGLDSVAGIPASFSYVTNSLNDYWLGGTYGCIIIQGTPTNADVGTYTLTLYTKIFLGGNPNNTQIHTIDYDFKVLDSSSVGFSNVQEDQFVVRQNAPNPFDYKTTIRFQSPKSTAIHFEVYSIDGKLIRAELIEAQKGINKIEFVKGDLPAGIYIYQLKNEKYNVRKRMIIR